MLQESQLCCCHHTNCQRDFKHRYRALNSFSDLGVGLAEDRRGAEGWSEVQLQLQLKHAS